MLARMLPFGLEGVWPQLRRQSSGNRYAFIRNPESNWGASKGMREAPIATAMNSIAALRAPELRSPYIQSIAVARRGRLVLDRYFYRFSAAQPHDVGRYRHRGRSRDPLTARAASRA
jgi:hypothetical protein